VGYLIAAYAIVIGAVVLYAVRLAQERRRLLALRAAGCQNAVDNEPRREV
jgi:hypothetical protein